jgi:flavorubredoxin
MTLLVYHPGKSGYQKLITQAFSDGLVSNGWRVEVTTASKEAPTNLSTYDLLVLSAPTYDWEPAKTIQRYLERLGDLEGQSTVVIVSAAGKSTRSLPFMEDLVREANGNLVASYTLWTLVPNRVAHGIDNAEVIMRQGAMKIPVPKQ